MARIDRKDFTCKESDYIAYNSLTSAKKDDIIKAAWPEVSNGELSTLKAEFAKGICSHKKERLYRAAKSLGYLP